MNTLSKAGIITVNWKNCKDTIECMESLLRQDYPEFQVFVIDNGSDDGSAEYIETWGEKELGSNFCSVLADEIEGMSFDQKVILLKSRENLGFAGGNNLACRTAMMTGAKYFWFINNDTVHDSNALSALIATVQTGYKAGIACSKILYSDKKDVIESMGATLLVPFGIFRHIGQGGKDCLTSSEPVEIPYIYGCSFLTTEELINDIGFMDERYFILIEESDWSIRARKKGWKLYLAPRSKVWHKVSATIGRRSEVFFYYVTRNTLLFMREHHPFFLPVTVVSLFALLLGLIIIDSLFSNRKIFKRLRMAALGYSHFLQGKFGKQFNGIA